MSKAKIAYGVITTAMIALTVTFEIKAQKIRNKRSKRAIEHLDNMRFVNARELTNVEVVA